MVISLTRVKGAVSLRSFIHHHNWFHSTKFATFVKLFRLFCQSFHTIISLNDHVFFPYDFWKIWVLSTYFIRDRKMFYVLKQHEIKNKRNKKKIKETNNDVLWNLSNFSKMDEKSQIINGLNNFAHHHHHLTKL